MKPTYEDGVIAFDNFIVNCIQPYWAQMGRSAIIGRLSVTTMDEHDFNVCKAILGRSFRYGEYKPNLIVYTFALRFQNTYTLDTYHLKCFKNRRTYPNMSMDSQNSLEQNLAKLKSCIVRLIACTGKKTAVAHTIPVATIPVATNPASMMTTVEHIAKSTADAVDITTTAAKSVLTSLATAATKVVLSYLPKVDPIQMLQTLQSSLTRANSDLLFSQPELTLNFGVSEIPKKNFMRSSIFSTKQVGLKCTLVYMNKSQCFSESGNIYISKDNVHFTNERNDVDFTSSNHASTYIKTTDKTIIQITGVDEITLFMLVIDRTKDNDQQIEDILTKLNSNQQGETGLLLLDNPDQEDENQEEDMSIKDTPETIRLKTLESDKYNLIVSTIHNVKIVEPTKYNLGYAYGTLVIRQQGAKFEPAPHSMMKNLDMDYTGEELISRRKLNVSITIGQYKMQYTVKSKEDNYNDVSNIRTFFKSNNNTVAWLNLFTQIKSTDTPTCMRTGLNGYFNVDISSSYIKENKSGILYWDDTTFFLYLGKHVDIYSVQINTITIEESLNVLKCELFKINDHTIRCKIEFENATQLNEIKQKIADTPSSPPRVDTGGAATTDLDRVTPDEVTCVMRQNNNTVHVNTLE